MRVRRGVALCVVAICLATPTTALAAGGGGSGTNPLSGFPTPPVSTQTTTSAATVANASSAAGGSSSVGGNTAVFIAVGALVLLGGISFYIWHDARHRAPVKAGADTGFPEGRRAGSKAPHKSRKLSPAERKRRKRGRAKR